MTNSQQTTIHFLDYWRVIRARKEIVIAVFLLIVLAGVALTLTMPKVYEASALVLVQQEIPDLPVFQQERLHYDPLFLRTQLEIIQSDPILEEVIKRQGLERKLSEALGLTGISADKITKIVFKIVSDSLKVQHYRDTSLIEIRISYTEPEGTANVEAAATVNLIAEVYREQNRLASMSIIEEALRALKEEWDRQEVELVEKESKLAEIREKHGIAHVGEGGTATALDLRGKAKLFEEQVRFELLHAREKALLEKLKELSLDKLEAAAVPLTQDRALDELIRIKRLAEIAHDELRESGYLENHPEVKSKKGAIERMQTEINDALQGLIIGIEARVETAKAQLLAIEVMLQADEVEDITEQAGAYLEFDKALEDLKNVRIVRHALQIRYIQHKIQSNIPSTTVRDIEKAKVPDIDDYVSPNKFLNIILSLFIGLFTGVALAFFIEYVDTSVKTVDDVESALEIPVIGVIPQKVDAFTDPHSYRDHAEAYRMLRTSVRFSERVKDAKTFCVTSGSVAEGKSLTLFNLGYVCAKLGDKVLVVDSDLHRPRQHKIIGVSNDNGLANVLVGDIDLEDGLIETEVENLDFLPSGRVGTSVHGLLDTNRMKELVKEVRKRYDIVLFDAPPIIGVSDTSLLVREVDGVMLVIQHRKFPKSVSVRAKAMVENAGGTIAGVVLNRINISKDYSYYYHYNYYSYYPRKEEPERISG
jgi:succinoglycan biosynthesis transport protein ExoP